VGVGRVSNSPVEYRKYVKKEQRHRDYYPFIVASPSQPILDAMPPFVTYTRSASPKLSTCTAHFDALFGKIHEALARHIPTTIIKMSSSIFTQQRETLYYKYKRLNKTIFKMLDPKGLLKGVGYEEATQIAQVLARDLAENLRDPVCNQLLDAIECRTEWGKRYKCAPQHMYDGHKTYINFLQGIQYQLSAYKKGKEATIEVIEQQLKAGEEEEGTMDDTKAGLTLEQAEFLAFLASLMALASEAAALWGEVAQGKLPIWTASTCKCSSVGSNNGQFALICCS
jgi:hypothetical protein